MEIEDCRQGEAEQDNNRSSSVVYELAGLPIKGNFEEHNIIYLKISRFVSMHQVNKRELNKALSMDPSTDFYI